MRNNPILTKQTWCAKLADKQAIKDSLAPFAPFPEIKDSYSEQLRQRVITVKNKKKFN